MNTGTVTLATIPALLALFVPQPIQVFLFLALFILVFVDLVTGLCKSYKTGLPISSQGLGATVNKMIAYFGLTCVSFVMAVIAKEVLMMGVIADGLLALVLSFCCLRESYSILENIQKINKHIRLPKFLKRLMHGLEDQLEDKKE